MTDLVRILPSFPVAPFAAVLPAIEQHAFTTTDLLALHPADIAKQTHLPLLDLKRLVAAIQASLSDDLVARQPLAKPKPEPRAEPADVDPVATNADAEPSPEHEERDQDPGEDQEDQEDRRESKTTPQCPPSLISTLDNDLDEALGGGIPVGVISEFAGESGAGKTQFLLSLCLAVQLPEPYGLGKQALYISTESGLATKRLAQMLTSNPILQSVDESERPSLDNVFSTVTPDLESQDHILEYQVPVLLERYNVGLLVLDSVAANYRAEFERQGSHGSNMAARSAELVRLGSLLRNLARKHNIAVVVANQVADRFASRIVTRGLTHRGPMSTQESPLATRSMPPPPSATFTSTPTSSIPFSFPDEATLAPPALLLDHQQRWFTGWGDDPHTSHSLKTPSLGLVWSTQIACRVALFKRPVYGRTRKAAHLEADDDDFEAGMPTLRAWRRWMKVVFAPHVGASKQGVEGANEFEVTMGGLRAVKKKTKKSTITQRGQG